MADLNPPATAVQDQDINPWSVEGAQGENGEVAAIDYDAICSKWKTSKIDHALLERFEQVTGKKPHRWLRRGLFFSHRDFDKILTKYEHGEPFFLYTGRGPSTGSLHLGHTIPLEFTKWLQDVFDVPLVFMLTDDEKALFKDNLTFEETLKYAMENARDIIALGFDQKKTFLYSDLQYLSGHFLMNAWEFSKLVTFNQVRGAFGFNESSNIGKIFFPSVQCVAAFATSYPEIWSDEPATTRTKALGKIQCLIPMGIDQDPYFRLVRDNAHRMKNPSPKPALIHSKFLTALQGAGSKMSSSNPNSAIFMTDTAKQIKNKINKFAFSGGRETLEEHREKGGNPDVDVAYIYLTYFEDDDEKLQKVYDDYKSGSLLTGELKKMAIESLQPVVQSFQERRAAVTDEVLESFMKPRKLQWGGNPNPKPKEDKKKEKAEKKPEEKKTELPDRTVEKSAMASFVSRSLRPAVARRFVSIPVRPLSTTVSLRSDNVSSQEFEVGELQGAKFRVEPLRRVGEDDATKRARLVYQSRKRGTLESDLLLSTFASAHLASLSPELLDQYDRILDENDWDIYYWATQKEELSSTNPSSADSPSTSNIDAKPSADQVTRQPPSGEWAQTVGNFKPAYRPVPSRWKDSEILEKLRAHVRSRSVDGGEGGGMGFMPPLGPSDVKN
ncbi:hypothetical protein HYE67_010921 [Fusarium culmorum]|nr:hypothetical protein HYE67_010921 [Fusarium culmorum]